jgi:hypothetical protein
MVFILSILTESRLQRAGWIVDKHTESMEQRKSNTAAFAMREAQKPFMGIIQSAFMMYMAGSQISIWSMMMTSMGIVNPLNQIFSVNAYFKRVRAVPCLLRPFP